MDNFYMSLALENAKKGIGKVNPNPMVGSIIVKNERMVASGFHKCYGGDHAEIDAFKNAVTATNNQQEAKAASTAIKR